MLKYIFFTPRNSQNPCTRNARENKKMKDTRVADLVADLIDAIVDHVKHFPSDEGDPLSLRAVLFVDDDDSEATAEVPWGTRARAEEEAPRAEEEAPRAEVRSETRGARRDLLTEMTRIATASDFVPVARCPRAKRDAFYDALCDYHAMFLTEDGTDLTSDEEMFAAFKNSVENIGREDAAEWMEERKELFRDAFERIRRDARARITETIVKVYTPPHGLLVEKETGREDGRTTPPVKMSPLERYLLDNAHV